ncbi:hypothetical protein FIBSPDRAFT_967569 [Athelia psychrophila]|uniref:Uncharacterized protein n=1 Tax=Athelia psychrophila TaxID=1759441 RepID=A0A167VK75_9AGAM|nr:hypothetical protein FIBSPDRAFT_967569 [Fibularhizoctonia sp. CBS 109695]
MSTQYYETREAWEWQALGQPYYETREEWERALMLMWQQLCAGEHQLEAMGAREQQAMGPQERERQQQARWRRQQERQQQVRQQQAMGQHAREAGEQQAREAREAGEAREEQARWQQQARQQQASPAFEFAPLDPASFTKTILCMSGVQPSRLLSKAPKKLRQATYSLTGLQETLERGTASACIREAED